MFQQTFMQKVLSVIISGFLAACLLWVLRHFVEQALWESGEGWNQMYQSNQSTPGRRVR